MERVLPLSPDRVRWNQRYSDASFVPDWAPDVVLAQRLPELRKGRALDVACGVGANSLFLLKRGYRVHAMDMSDVALERLRRAASSEGVLEKLEIELADIREKELEQDTYDLIVCFRFFISDLAPRLVAALKPGGTLLSKVFTTAHLQAHPNWPKERVVAPGELPSLFAGLDSVAYEESTTPANACALFIGKKPE